MNNVAIKGDRVDKLCDVVELNGIIVVYCRENGQPLLGKFCVRGFSRRKRLEESVWVSVINSCSMLSIEKCFVFLLVFSPQLREKENNEKHTYVLTTK